MNTVADFQLDDLDRRLLVHFRGRFARPVSLDHGEPDVTAEEAARVCGGGTLFEEDLVELFVSHNRLGFIGDWTSFPPFAGEIAVHCRRSSLRLEHDLAFFFLHLGAEGRFDGSDTPVLLEWVTDQLMPWLRPIRRGDYLDWREHALGYLALLAMLGGDPAATLRANLERQEAPTKVVSTLAGLLDRHGRPDVTRVRNHFAGMGRSASNQTLPTLELVHPMHVDAVLSALAVLAS